MQRTHRRFMPQTTQSCTLLIVTLLMTALAGLPAVTEAATPLPTEEESRDPRNSPKVIAPSPQRTGDASAGREYLVQGNYLTSGVPLGMVKRVYSAGVPNYLRRTGASAAVPFDYNLVTSSNGHPIIVPNCLQCHAQKIDGQFIMGVGNTFVNFARDLGPTAATIDLLLAAKYGTNSEQREDYRRFKTSIIAVAPYIKTKVRGVHSADKLAFVLAVHRDSNDLQWRTPREVPTALHGEAIPTDVPPWWVLKKKNAMFYAATGRGDFARIMMASSLVTLEDTTEASEIDKHFVDVFAFLKTIEPPAYPQPINKELAASGRQLFTDNCVRCHGTYGEEETYPNLLVPVETVGTDPLLAQANGTKYRTYFESHRDSWFGQPPHAAKLVITNGYIAPPLDGIWVTAPYLHNGSVPDLMTLLNSPTRPTAWKRSFRSNDYDYETVGWRYEEITPQERPDSSIYDTTNPGYGNKGHQFGDHFNAIERKSIVEYLKTL